MLIERFIFLNICNASLIKARSFSVILIAASAVYVLSQYNSFGFESIFQERERETNH